MVVSKSKIEIIDLFNAKNKHEFVDQTFSCISSRLFGTYFQNQFLGFLGNNCLDLENPDKKFELLQDRTCGSCVLLDSNKLWMTGGCYNRTPTTEIISYNQNSNTMITNSGPNLPFLIDYHCMIKKNSKTIFIIGGIVNFQESSKTWIVDTSNLSELKPGPSLNIPRSGASCAKMQLNGKIFIVIFGGDTETVEILDISTPNQGWTMGKIKLYFEFFAY